VPITNISILHGGARGSAKENQGKKKKKTEAEFVRDTPIQEGKNDEKEKKIFDTNSFTRCTAKRGKQPQGNGGYVRS